MKRLVVIALCGLAGAGLAATKAELQRKTLAQSTEIQGYQCAKGYAWFYPGERLEGCTVAQDTDFGEARVPAGSGINLTRDGRPSSVFLKHDTEIASYRCEGGNWLLGPSEGAITAFYPSGKLKLCWLAADREVQGVPCASSGMFTGNSSVEFYENGKLQACKLAKDYGRGKRGERFSQTR